MCPVLNNNTSFFEVRRETTLQAKHGVAAAHLLLDGSIITMVERIVFNVVFFSNIIHFPFLPHFDWLLPLRLGLSYV